MPVRTKSNELNCYVATLDSFRKLPAFSIPKTNRSVRAARRYNLPARVKRERKDRVFVPAQSSTQNPSRHIPRPHGAVATARCQCLSVRAQSNAIYRIAVPLTIDVRLDQALENSSTEGTTTKIASAPVLVADLLHPIDHLPVKALLNRDVSHGRSRRGCMPVLLAG